MKTPRTKLGRVPNRGSHDRETIEAILDEALIGHVAWVQDGRPVVIPTLIARDGDKLLIHGSSKSRTLKALRAGTEACVEVTHVDGLVLARSAFHHSMNYRSAILYGTLAAEPDVERALEIFTNKLVPGRWEHVRWPIRAGAQGDRGASASRSPRARRRSAPATPSTTKRTTRWTHGPASSRSRSSRGAPTPDERLNAEIELPEHVSALTARS